MFDVNDVDVCVLLIVVCVVNFWFVVGWNNGVVVFVVVFDVIEDDVVLSLEIVCVRCVCV